MRKQLDIHVRGSLHVDGREKDHSDHFIFFRRQLILRPQKHFGDHIHPTGRMLDSTVLFTYGHILLDNVRLCKSNEVHNDVHNRDSLLK